MRYLTNWMSDIQEAGVEHFNLFYVSVPFLYPQKTSDKQRFSDVFRVSRDAKLVGNRLTL